MGQALKEIVDQVISDYTKYLANANSQIYCCEKIRLSYEVQGQDFKKIYTDEQSEKIRISIEELLKNSVESMTKVRVQYIKEGIQSLISPRHIDGVKEMAIEGEIKVLLVLDNKAYLSIIDQGCGLPQGYETLPFEKWESAFKGGCKPGNKGVKLAFDYLSPFGISLKYERRKIGTATILTFPP